MSTLSTLKIDGIAGESAHADHPGEIDLLSWSWGAHNDPGPAPPTAGAGRARPTADLLSFTHRYDRASPLLARALAQGVALKQAVLTARKNRTGQQEFLKVVLREVYLASVSFGTGPGGEADVIETVTLRFGALDLGYQSADAGGAPSPELRFGWNVHTGQVS